VDTHIDTHVAGITDPLGRHLDHATFDTTPAGHRALMAWSAGFGNIVGFGIEGTGSYGAGLARTVAAHGHTVTEVDRPDRKTRRNAGKTDPIDAYAAAIAVASGRATGTPKTRTGDVESIRVLRVARTGAVRCRAKAITQLKAIIVSAPDAIRAHLDGLTTNALVGTCARLRAARDDTSDQRLVDCAAATKRSLSSIARRVTDLDAEIADLDADLEALVTPLAPTLLALQGVGIEVAGQLLVTAGDNVERLRNESAFAHLCGVAPIPASSGRTTRHRLNRGGDRQANAALYRIVLCRLRWDPATRDYAQRRTEQGRTKPEIIRCLKRYVAREVFAAIVDDLTKKPLDKP